MMEDIRRILGQALNTNIYYNLGSLSVVFNIRVEEIPLGGMHCVSTPYSLQTTCVVNIALFRIKSWRINTGMRKTKIIRQFRDTYATIGAAYEVNPPHFTFALNPIEQSNRAMGLASGQYLWECIQAHELPRQRECGIELIQHALLKQLPRSCRVTKLLPPIEI